MRQTRLIIGALAVTSALVGPLVASAGQTECVGTLPPGVYENIVVQAGGSCFLNGTIITGDVKVFQDGFLDTINSIVRGSVVAMSAFAVFLDSDDIGGSVVIRDVNVGDVRSSRIEGNVEMTGGNPFVGTFDVVDNAIGGHLKLDGQGQTFYVVCSN